MIKVGFEPTDEQRTYLAAAARIRGVSPQTLMRRLMKLVLDEQLILNILDDQDEYETRAMTIVQKARAGMLTL